MFFSKLKIASAALLIIAVLGIGVGASLRAGAQDDGDPGVAAQQPPERKRGLPDKKAEAPRDDRAALTQRLEALERTVERLTSELEKSRKVGLSRGSRGDGVEPPPPPAKLEVKIFNLRQADASEVAATLKQLLGPDPEGNRFPQRPGQPPGGWGTLRIATHQSTNSVLVQGTTEELETIAAILIQLDDQAPKERKKIAEPKPPNIRSR